MPKEKEEKLKKEQPKEVAEPQEEKVENIEIEETITESIETDSEAPEIQESNESELPTQDIEAEQTVTVQPVKFASFEDLGHPQGEANQNLAILMDIKLQLTVELGRTELPIKKVLELTRGSIIELEKVAGEPVELYANGKLVAHGEVVVIEDNFGLRITSITEPEDMLKGLKD